MLPGAVAAVTVDATHGGTLHPTLLRPPHHQSKGTCTHTQPQR
eukprot:COSAG05_NODE_24197_length_253_cov_0.662338_1_plen_42_part_10